jgi:TolB-like protein
MKILSLLMILVTFFLLSACSSVEKSSNDSLLDSTFDSFFDDDENDTDTLLEKEAIQVNRVQNNHNDILIHQNVTRLANNLFRNAKNIKTSQSIAVGTFLPINLNNNPNLAAQHYIGLQIQESFITLAAQAGLNVVEFKTASAIKITPNADVMLSRDTSMLTSSIQAKYFLTGTYSEHDNKLVVNARIIELAEQKIIAAATGSIPMPSLNDKQKITMRNEMLYRKAL